MIFSLAYLFQLTCHFVSLHPTEFFIEKVEAKKESILEVLKVTNGNSWKKEV
jgi:hypothetical protein